jgi:hypothetical protein
MNENFVVWIMASIFEHFKEASKLIIPTQELPSPANLPSDRFELMVLGPDFEEITSDQISGKIVINLLCISNMIPADPYYQYKWLGKGLIKFAKCIPIYNYGTGEVTPSIVGQLTLITDRKITDIKPFDVVSRQQRGTIEATYEIRL